MKHQVLALCAVTVSLYLGGCGGGTMGTGVLTHGPGEGQAVGFAEAKPEVDIRSLFKRKVQVTCESPAITPLVESTLKSKDLSSLYNDSKAWRALIEGIAGAEPPCLKIADSIMEFANGAVFQELGVAVGLALSRNPETAFELLPHLGMNADRLRFACTSTPEDSVHNIEMQKEVLFLRSQKLKILPPGVWDWARAICLSELEAAMK